MPRQRDDGKFEHTQGEERFLITKGFKPVVSSNVSAVGRRDEVLFVRFHGGATYAYPESGNLYQKMINSSSKGKFVWNELRRKNVPYYKTGSVNLKPDV